MAYITKSGAPLVSNSLQTGAEHIISIIQAENDKVFESARLDYRQLEHEFKMFRETSARRVDEQFAQLSNATAEAEKCRKDLDRLSRAIAKIGIIYSPTNSGRLAFHGEWAILMSEMEKHRNVSGSGNDTNYQTAHPKKIPSPLIVLEQLRRRMETNQLDLEALRKRCHTLELEKDELKRILSSSPHVTVKSPGSKSIPVSVDRPYTRIEEPKEHRIQTETRLVNGTILYPHSSI